MCRLAEGLLAEASSYCSAHAQTLVTYKAGMGQLAMGSSPAEQMGPRRGRQQSTHVRSATCVFISCAFNP